jgi:hypothetical protein
MNNLLFKKWNDFSGWIVFLIAATPLNDIA